MSGTGVPHHRLCSVEDRTLGMTKALFLSGSPQVLSPATKCDDLQYMPSIRTHLSRVRPLYERRTLDSSDRHFAERMVMPPRISKARRLLAPTDPGGASCSDDRHLRL